MSVMIRSDKNCTNSLGNIYEIKSNLDFLFMLDFNLDEYVAKTQNGFKRLSLPEAISVSRATQGYYIARDGSEKLAQPNTPRLSYRESHNSTGLLLEGVRKNLLANPEAPATQSVTISGATSTSILVLSVRGSGSAVISGAGVQASSGAATEGSPASARMVAGLSQSVTITVTGDLTFFQLEYMAGTSELTSASSSLKGITERDSDKFQLSALLSAKVPHIKSILLQVIPNNMPTVHFTTNVEVVKISGVQPESGHISLDLSQGSSPLYLSKVTARSPLTSSGAARFDGVNTNSVEKVTMLLTFDTGGVQALLGANGNVGPLKGDSTPINYTDLKLLPFGGVVTKLAAFDYKLSQSDAEIMSSSWV